MFTLCFLYVVGTRFCYGMNVKYTRTMLYDVPPTVTIIASLQTVPIDDKLAT